MYLQCGQLDEIIDCVLLLDDKWSQTFVRDFTARCPWRHFTWRWGIEDNQTRYQGRSFEYISSRRKQCHVSHLTLRAAMILNVSISIECHGAYLNRVRSLFVHLDCRLSPVDRERGCATANVKHEYQVQSLYCNERNVTKWNGLSCFAGGRRTTKGGGHSPITTEINGNR